MINHTARRRWADFLFYYLDIPNSYLVKRRTWFLFFAGVVSGAVIVAGFGKGVKTTSTNNFCAVCHVHPQAITSWKQGVHYATQSGYHVGCTGCHLPPQGEGYLVEKAKTGIRDLWSYLTKDSADFDWEAASTLGRASGHVYNSSCVSCHENLFPAKMTSAGSDAHLYYKQMTEKGESLQCISCHLNAGHYIEGYMHGSNSGFGAAEAKPDTIYDAPSAISSFSDFTERIPGSGVSFRMIAVPGGRFIMGSPDDEPLRDTDESPREMEVDSFFIAEVEVTWDEFMEFYRQTASEGRSTDTEGSRTKDKGVDAVSGATPPYGKPDQNWGMGQRPAISMSWHAAETYCRWLSKVTGKSYRLPREAEWEYACRAGTTTPYFFPGDPARFEKRGLFRGRPDTTVIGTYVIYSGNSPSKTQAPSAVKPNPWGIKNMSGNVAEFCSDFYEGTSEHVIRGGSFREGAAGVRSASRDHTLTDEWLKTDPQMPKSIWWYSDCFNVGFRVVMDYKSGNYGPGANN
jgi:formylglycine-generating enzyme required for sulfatase activity/nitrate/TMAO reductase-like tetraheme cytochrome c subunit